MRSDDVNLRHGYILCITELLSGRRECLAEQDVHLREFLRCSGVLQNHLHHSTFDALLQWDLAVLDVILVCFLEVLFGNLPLEARNASQM